MTGGVLTTLILALQLLVILPVQAADAQLLRGQGPGQDTCSAFAHGGLGVCLPPGALRACAIRGLAAKPVFTVETWAAWVGGDGGKRMPPAPAGRDPPVDQP